MWNNFSNFSFSLICPILKNGINLNFHDYIFYLSMFSLKFCPIGMSYKKYGKKTMIYLIAKPIPKFSK